MATRRGTENRPQPTEVEMAPLASSAKTLAIDFGKETSSGPVDFSKNADSALPPPNNTVPALQRWNHPKTNMWRVFATFYSFIILGANDAAYGVRRLPQSIPNQVKLISVTGAHSLRMIKSPRARQLATDCFSLKLTTTSIILSFLSSSCLLWVAILCLRSCSTLSICALGREELLP